MNPLLQLIAPYVGVACALGVLYAIVVVIMAAGDRRKREAEREARREREFWHTVTTDPRKSKRGNWRPPNGGFAA